MLDFDALVLAPCQDAFGEPVQYTPAEGGAQTIVGIFDRAYLELTPMGGGAQEPARLGAVGNVTGRRPVLGIRLSDFPTGKPVQNEGIYVPSVQIGYTIKEVQPDGKGGAKLLLTRYEPGVGQPPIARPVSPYPPHDYSAMVTGDGTSDTYDVPHPLNTQKVLVQVCDPNDMFHEIGTVDILRPTVGIVRVMLTDPLAPAAQILVLISKVGS